MDYYICAFGAIFATCRRIVASRLESCHLHATHSPELGVHECVRAERVHPWGGVRSLAYVLIRSVVASALGGRSREASRAALSRSLAPSEK
ncbi:hypothetical protein MPTK1_3g05420 [Marchantia polymorpha subsp. ruderalis]|uniref:Uncharacterized protein n=2 Tax=Marchantia polymorpha TaxID=3197 RepID=A0AAF6AXP4_MARPO|nr:hypothetical protein MARPO_0006s0015 [Marchantia polymorpha]BBN04528.1 hypothetical protein Mp_3g05420 [Marchantia polymorpha subsp. ruderalis]|eukprot:PTQ47964.1 hypothetical protein MARPO_0006s0015 [Marchantia polymorpha]